MPGETILARIGMRSILAHTTGHDTRLIYICLAAMMDGQKLKPFLIIKEVYPVLELNNIQDIVGIQPQWLAEPGPDKTPGWFSVGGGGYWTWQEAPCMGCKT